MKHIIKLFMIVVMLCASQAFAQQEAGSNYKTLNPPLPIHSGKKIEVLAFFSYNCEYSFKLNPLMTSFQETLPKDAELTYVPVVINAHEENLARTFYALESLGLVEQMHEDLFNVWHIDNIPLMDEADSTDFVTKRGVNRKEFSNAYNSPSVLSKVAQAKQMALSYKIPGTPTLVVDGKYLVSGKGSTETIVTLYDLLDKSRQERMLRGSLTYP